MTAPRSLRSERIHERVAREDLLAFISACFACTGQREFYSDGRGQSISISFLHDYVAGNYRSLYARVLACGINDYNQVEILFRLLRDGKSVAEEDRKLEGELIYRALERLPPQRVMRLFHRLATARVNNRRTRAIIRRYLTMRGAAEHGRTNHASDHATRHERVGERDRVGERNRVGERDRAGGESVGESSSDAGEHKRVGEPVTAGERGLADERVESSSDAREHERVGEPVTAGERERERERAKWRERRTFWAVKYRRRFRTALAHAHVSFEGELRPLFTKGWQQARYETPLFDSFRRAHYAESALYELPYTIAEGLAGKHKVARDVFLRKIEPRMTAVERLRLQDATKDALGKSVAMDPTRLPLTRVASYVLSLPHAERVARQADLQSMLRASADRGARITGARFERVACVLDNSHSSSGSTEKRRRPLAVALAVSAFVQACAAEHRSFWTHPPTNPITNVALVTSAPPAPVAAIPTAPVAPRAADPRAHASAPGPAPVVADTSIAPIAPIALIARDASGAADARALHSHVVDGGNEVLVQPYGATDLTTPILAALAWQPDLIVIVSDGFDNDPPNTAGQVLTIAQKKRLIVAAASAVTSTDVGVDTSANPPAATDAVASAADTSPLATDVDAVARASASPRAAEAPRAMFILHVNPVFDDKSLGPKPLAPLTIPTVGIRDAEDLPTALAFAELAFTDGRVTLKDLDRVLNARVTHFLRPAHSGGSSATGGLAPEGVSS